MLHFYLRIMPDKWHQIKGKMWGTDEDHNEAEHRHGKVEEWCCYPGGSCQQKWDPTKRNIDYEGCNTTKGSGAPKL